jgi:Pentapeptide repeats (9 copies)
MKTEVAAVEPKKVVSVEILHLDELGYGPQGKHTRREWRAECLENLLAGKEQFEAWQASWNDKINENLPKISLAATLSYDDGSIEEILNESYQRVSPATLDFGAHTFESQVNAVDFVFTGAAYFRNATFTKAAYFRSATFTGDADFSSATFTGEADFDSATFIGKANFSSATFTVHAYFSCTTFSEFAYFSNSTVIGDASFTFATFISWAYFNSTRFTGHASFGSATFRWFADFVSATFSGDCYFQGATFAGKADFLRAKFINQCRFDLAGTFENLTLEWLRETWFMAEVNFENAEFQNLGHFEGARFKAATPKFRGCKIGETRLEFDGDNYFPQGEQSTEAIKNISFLKRLSDEHGQTDQALMFNAMELKAKRAQARSNTQHLSFKQKLHSSEYWFANATALYERFSDYGRSFFEPLKWYLALLGVTLYLAIAHAIYFTNKECPDEYANIFSYLWRDQIECKKSEKEIVLSGWRAAVEYTSYRASGILDFADSDKQTIAISNRLFNQAIEPPWMRAWGIFKGIASIALLFLAALGLRNKYRIK